MKIPPRFVSVLFSFALLDPKGIVAREQRNLIFLTTGLMLAVVAAVFIMLFWFVRKYRSDNEKTAYSPDTESTGFVQVLFWGFLFILIGVIGIMNWRSAHDLDPYKPIASDKEPLTIQVVALEWKWLFIYPEQRIATVNFVEFPVGTPVTFNLTADAPMSSFWIPNLGGQMYAMSAMETKIHLQADETGEFPGYATEINGRGFSGMKFTAKSASLSDFNEWVASVRSLPGSALTDEQYKKLAQPSENNERAFYSWVSPDLYNSIMMQFTIPGAHQ